MIPAVDRDDGAVESFVETVGTRSIGTRRGFSPPNSPKTAHVRLWGLFPCAPLRSLAYELGERVSASRGDLSKAPAESLLFGEK